MCPAYYNHSVSVRINIFINPLSPDGETYIPADISSPLSSLSVSPAVSVSVVVWPIRYPLYASLPSNSECMVHPSSTDFLPMRVSTVPHTLYRFVEMYVVLSLTSTIININHDDDRTFPSPSSNVFHIFPSTHATWALLFFFLFPLALALASFPDPQSDPSLFPHKERERCIFNPFKRFLRFI